MLNYLLDTNHLSPLVTPGHPLRARIAGTMEHGTEFAILAVVLAESLFGIQSLPRAQANLAEWSRLQGSFGYFPIVKDDAEDAANLQFAMRRQGWQLALVDALIAVIAIRSNLVLLTTDGDFQFIPNLQQENWLKPLWQLWKTR